MENCSWAIESGWTWTGGSTTSKDTWTEIWGDGADAAVKDSAAIVLLNFRWRSSGITLIVSILK